MAGREPSSSWIVGELFPELDGFELKSEALAARMFVFEHQDEFRVLVDPKQPEKGRRLCLFTIYERLYSGDVCSKPIPSFLHVLDYVISSMWQSCNSERAGPHINRVKTLERIGPFSGTPSIHLCLVPLTMHRCKSSALPVLYPTGAVKDT